MPVTPLVNQFTPARSTDPATPTCCCCCSCCCVGTAAGFAIGLPLAVGLMSPSQREVDNATAACRADVEQAASTTGREAALVGLRAQRRGLAVLLAALALPLAIGVAWGLMQANQGSVAIIGFFVILVGLLAASVAQATAPARAGFVYAGLVVLAVVAAGCELSTVANSSSDAYVPVAFACFAVLVSAAVGGALLVRRSWRSRTT